MYLKSEEFGRIEVSTLSLPDEIRSIIHPIYTFTGTVIFAYRTINDPQDDNFYRIATINDDGTNLRQIYSGNINLKKTGNGFRLMPFHDNKRVLLGDFILECEPCIDTCEKAELVELDYPGFLFEAPELYMHWSEIVIAPDNRHMAWTCLVGEGAVNFIGRLKKDNNRYVLENVHTISTSKDVEEDFANPGYYKAVPLIGGEIKQFIHGGASLSLVGSVASCLPDSVEQDLKTGKTTAVTCMPGYEETTIFSPDEKLGITMSTRGSEKTNFAVLGLMPRPYGYLVTGALNNCVYMYAVAGARFFRKANVGPVLIDIEKSKQQRGYLGVQLNDPEEEWVYCSPISWHPGGQKAMWPEILRGKGKDRIQIVHLPDYKPKAAVAASAVPIPENYGANPSDALLKPLGKDVNGKIQGENSGYAEICFVQKDAEKHTGTFRQIIYYNYSDDGANFYNGYEKLNTTPGNGLVYEANLTLKGENTGKMDMRVSFTEFQYTAPPSLRFETAADGRPESYGSAEYNGKSLSIEDMKE